MNLEIIALFCCFHQLPCPSLRPFEGLLYCNGALQGPSTFLGWLHPELQKTSLIVNCNKKLKKQMEFELVSIDSN